MIMIIMIVINIANVIITGGGLHSLSVFWLFLLSLMQRDLTRVVERSDIIAGVYSAVGYPQCVVLVM